MERDTSMLAISEREFWTLLLQCNAHPVLDIIQDRALLKMGILPEGEWLIADIPLTYLGRGEVVEAAEGTRFWHYTPEEGGVWG